MRHRGDKSSFTQALREERLRELAREGILAWSRKKLQPLDFDPPRVRGDRTIADLILEDREPS